LARSVAAEYGIKLPQLEIDFVQDLGKDKVDWFYFRLGNGDSDIEDGDNELSLRYKEKVEGV